MPLWRTREKASETALLGTVIAEATTRVSVEERLVDFSTFRITQANFPTASKEQASAAVAAITASIPAAERVIALDRVLAFLDSSAIRPKNVTGLKADPPVVFSSTRTAILVNHRRRADLEPDREQRSPLCGQHELGSVRACAVGVVLSQTREDLVEGDRGHGTVGGRRHAARQLQQAPCRRQLEGREGDPAGTESRRTGGTDRVRQHRASGVDPPAWRCPVRAGARHEAVVGAQHRLGRVPPRHDGTAVLPGRRTVVLRARFRRPVDVCVTDAARGFQANSARTRTVARAGLGARHGAGGGSRAAGAGAADRACEQEGAQASRRRLSRRAGVRAHRDHQRRPRHQHRQGHLQDWQPLLHVLSRRLVHGADAERPLGSHRFGSASRSTRSP